MRRRTDFWLGLWTLCFIAATAAVAYFSPLAPKAAGPPQIALHVTDQAGRVRVDCDKDDPLIQSARVEQFRLLHRAGKTAAAAREARAYLSAFPNGFARAEAKQLALADLGSP